MHDNGSPVPSVTLPTMVRELFDDGNIVQVYFDAFAPGVVLPPHLERRSDLSFEYARPEHTQIPIPDLDIGEHGIRATLSIERVPSLTFVPWSAVKRVVPHRPRSELRCSLCSKTAKEVRMLVQGEAGCVCDDCLGWAISALDQPTQPRTNAYLLRAICTGLDCINPPSDDCVPLLRAALALSLGRRADLQLVARHARRFSREDIAVDAERLAAAAE